MQINWEGMHMCVHKESSLFYEFKKGESLPNLRA